MISHRSSWRVWSWSGAGRVLAVVLLAGMGATYFHRLGNGDLKDWDESLYAVRALAIVQHGGMAWIDQKPWSRKEVNAFGEEPSGYYSASFPPLLPWLSALSFHAFGVSEWSFRFPVTLVAASGLFAVFLLVEFWEGIAAGLAAAACLFDVLFFTVYARRGQFDALYITWLVWSLCAYQAAVMAPGRRRRRWLLGAAGVALGLSAMSKIALGVVFFVALTVPAIAVRLARGTTSWRAVVEEIGIVGGVALAVWLPWHAAMTVLAGREFWDWYVGFHLLNRAGRVLDNHGHPWWLYFAVLYDRVNPRSLGLLAVGLVLAAAALLPGRWRPVAPRAGAGGASSDRDVSRVWPAAGWAFLFPLALLTVATTKRDVYILVLMPFLSILVGLTLGALWNGRLKTAWLLPLTLLATWAAVWDRMPGERKNFEKLIDLLAMGDRQVEPLAYLGHVAPRVLTGGTLALVGLLGLSWLAARVAGRGRLRWQVVMGRLLLVGYTAFTIHAAWEDSIVPERGRRFYGFAGVRPVVHARLHDDLLFFGQYNQPAVGFYLLGAMWADEALGPVTEARTFADAVARLERGDIARMLVIMDRATIPRHEADTLSHMLRERGWRFLGRAEHLFVYSPPDLEYPGELLLGLTRRVPQADLTRYEEAARNMEEPVPLESD